MRPLRFHDLRHTTASLLMMAGANPAAVQRILRHRDPRTTTEVYGHLAPGYLRAEVDRLNFGTPEQEPSVVRQAANAPFAASLLQDVAESATSGPEKPLEPLAIAVVPSARHAEFESATFGFGGASGTLSTGSKPLQAVRTTQGGRDNQVPDSQTDARFRKPFAAPVLQGSRTTLRALEGGRDHLLSVRQVALRLGVCTATVYALCNRGELRHVRILSAIRIAPSDLADLLNHQPAGGRRR